MAAKPASAVASEEVKLYKATGPVVIPGKPIAPGELPVQALDLFGSVLTNSVEDVKNYGNVFVAWEQIPKFAADSLNNKEGVVPNDYSTPFNILKKEAKITLFPGTCYEKGKSIRRYPGVKEQQVEQALINHSLAQNEEQTVNGFTSYFVTFTINAISRRLKDMGSSMSNVQIRQALDVLSSSVMTLTYGEDHTRDNRDTIISSFDRNANAKDGNNGDDIWRVRLHPLIVQSILQVTYRQYPIDKVKHYSPVGGALLRRIFFIMTNVSEENPYKFTVLELKKIIAGLTHVRLSGSMIAIKKELDRMITDRYLDRYVMDEIFPVKRGRGRPVPIDYRFTLYPGPDWIKNMKAGSLRQSLTEQRLGLPRSKRPEREQMVLDV
mgnify:CR=1 FL=1